MSAARMHEDEIAIDDGLVRSLLAHQFPQWSDLPLRRFPSPGTVNALYRLGADKVVRLPLQPGDSDIPKERDLLSRLAPLLPITTPNCLAYGVPTAHYPCDWAVYEWLDGINPAPDDLIDPQGLALDLAHFVDAMRRIQPADGPPAYRGDHLGTQDRQTRTAIAQLDGMIDTEAATSTWEAALHAPVWTDQPVWVHADLMPGNLLTVDGRLSAVIDFATAGVGDPACDLIVAWNLLPATARPVFRDALQVDDATWIRGRGRALSMALIQLPYYQHTNIAMATNARHVIREALADQRSQDSGTGA